MRFTGNGLPQLLWLTLVLVGSSLGGVTQLAAEESPESEAEQADDPVWDARVWVDPGDGQEAWPLGQNPFRLTQQEALQPAPAPLSLLGAEPLESVALAGSVFGLGDFDRSLLSATRQRRASSLTSGVTLGRESLYRATTDTGNLLGKSNSAPGVTTQRRGPILTEVRVRGSSPGQVLGSGSYWFPARPDLDTMLSKIDSRIISDVIVIRGPYAARYGPAFSFIDVALLPAPRFEDGFEAHGSTGLEYKTNGEQWNGRQMVLAGAENYGIRLSYGHRTGSDYLAGNGEQFIGSYNSRDFDFAFGYDVTPDRHLEFNYLRLDQTDVELPNQFLDIGVLTTDGFEVNYLIEDSNLFELVAMEAWYNATEIRGNANSPGKRELIPFIPATNLSVNSDSSNASTGFSMAGTAGEAECVQNTVGVDLRYLRQEINQIFPGDTLFSPPPGIPFNQPLPQAYSANPGLFFEQIRTVRDGLVLNAGGRFDLVDTNAAQTAPLVETHGFPPLDSDTITFDLEEALGGGNFNRHFTLGSGYLSATQELNSNWYAVAGAAFAMRPPTMAELYSVGPIVSTFPQRTVMTLAGNPRLRSEKRYQIDAGLFTAGDSWRAGIDGYHAWVTDYITYERIIQGSSLLALTQTDLATLTGFDAYAELGLSAHWMAFATMSYVQGEDRTRNVNAIPASRYRSPDALRSNTDIASEPLPMIPPLESRLGLVLRQQASDPRWATELTLRMVADQNRIAESLGELPTDGFATLDLRGYWRAGRGLTLVAGVENLTDTFYQEHFDSHAQDFGAPLPSDVGGGVVMIPGTRDVYRPGVNFYFGSELVY